MPPGLYLGYRAAAGVMLSLALSVAVLASLALIGAGGWMFFKRRDRKRAGLMVAAGLVTLFNVWSWSGLIQPEPPTTPSASRS